jgi:hypothetical protein
MSDILKDVLAVIKEFEEKTPWSKYRASLRISHAVDAGQVYVIAEPFTDTPRYNVYMTKTTYNEIRQLKPEVDDRTLAQLCVYYVDVVQKRKPEDPFRFRGLDLTTS